MSHSLPTYYFTPEDKDRPTLPEILRLNIPQGIGANYNTFGILLLDDTTGSRVAGIQYECRGQPERICQRILQEWLEGRGVVPLSWQTLIRILRQSELITLAEKVQEALLQI